MIFPAPRLCGGDAGGAHVDLDLDRELQELQLPGVVNSAYRKRSDSGLCVGSVADLGACRDVDSTGSNSRLIATGAADSGASGFIATGVADLGAYGDVDGQRLHSGHIASADSGVASGVLYDVSPANFSSAVMLTGANVRSRRALILPVGIVLSDSDCRRFNPALWSLPLKLMPSLNLSSTALRPGFPEQCERTRRSIISRLDVPARPKWLALPRASLDGHMLPVFLMDRLVVVSVE